MKSPGLPAGLFLFVSLLCSCSTYKIPSTAYGPQPDDPHCEIRQKAVRSSIYNYVPRKREQLRPLDIRWLTWCLAGNEDDGIFGEYAGKKPYSTNINFKTYCSWSIFRNPIHNFTFYVIGTAAWKRHYNFSLLSFGGNKKVRAASNAGKREKHDNPFADIGFNDFKPYVGFDPWIFDWYFGWRKDGSFEIKFRADLHKHRKSATTVARACETLNSQLQSAEAPKPSPF
ncbi:MAG: hypothetical protein C5B50_23220 [Verrucomicrobia bacterium]|nr:MAG: hypothetical protein C5B50_23220 [Verrucomicrobiota bacterium]